MPEGFVELAFCIESGTESKAIQVPLGDQAGSEANGTSAGSPRILRPAPSAWTTQSTMLPPLDCSPANAMLLPSGDHVGRSISAH